MTANRPRTSGLREVFSHDCRSKITCIDVSRNGVVATGTREGQIILFNLWENAQVTGELISSHLSSATTLSLSPNGESLVSGTVLGTLHLWNVRTRKENKCMTLMPSESMEPLGQPKPVRDVVRSYDGQLYAAFIGCVIYIIDKDAMAVSKMMLNGPGRCPTWLHDHTLVCAVDANLYVWSQYQETVASQNFLQEVIPTAFQSVVTAMAACKREGPSCALAVSSEDGTVILYKTGQEETLQSDAILKQSPGHVTEMSWDADGRFLTVCVEGNISLWDTESPSGMPVHTECSVDTAIEKLAMHRELPLLAAVTSDSSIAFFDASSTKGEPLCPPSPRPTSTDGQSGSSPPSLLNWHQSGLLLLSEDSSKLEVWQIINPAVSSYLAEANKRAGKIHSKCPLTGDTNGFKLASAKTKRQSVEETDDHDDNPDRPVRVNPGSTSGGLSPIASPPRPDVASPPSDVSTPQPPESAGSNRACLLQADDEDRASSLSSAVERLTARPPPPPPPPPPLAVVLPQDPEASNTDAVPLPISAEEPPRATSPSAEVAHVDPVSRAAPLATSPHIGDTAGSTSGTPATAQAFYPQAGNRPPQPPHNVQPMSPGYYMQGGPAWFPTTAVPHVAGAHPRAGGVPMGAPHCNAIPGVSFISGSTLFLPAGEFMQQEVCPSLSSWGDLIHEFLWICQVVPGPGMMGMMPSQHGNPTPQQWQLYQQQMAAAQQWQLQQLQAAQQQQAAYMAYYQGGPGMHLTQASGPVTGGMYAQMQMTPPAMLPHHGGSGGIPGVMPGMEGLDTGDQYVSHTHIPRWPTCFLFGLIAFCRCCSV